MAPSSSYVFDAKAVARRLRALRQWEEGSDHGARTIFARKVGIDRANWSHYERTGDIPRKSIDLLMQYFAGWIFSDWIYYGVTDGMRPDVADELAQAERAVGASDLVFSQAHELSHVQLRQVDSKPRHYSGSGRKKPVTKSRV